MNYLRVTEVLSPFSGLSKVDPEILRNACVRGETIHKYCDAIIEEIGASDINPDWMGYIESFEQWKEGKVFLPKIARLYCNTHFITGEIDGLYQDEQGIVLFDLKTPANESKTWKYQASAYGYLCSSNGINPYKLEFVKLCKKGKPARSYFYDGDFGAFLKLLEVYREFFSKEQIIDNTDYL